MYLNTRYSFLVTLIISIVVQIITGIIEVFSLFIKVPKQFSLISQLLILEVSVQVIEGLFYIWLAYNFNAVTDVTPKRYIDWSITTPTMLITLISYLIYLGHREKNDTSKLELFSLLSKNSHTISIILYLNWLMLIFGYLGEKKIIPTYAGVLLGFIPFMIYYFLIYINYVVLSKNGYLIFWYFFFFWSIYGFVATFPYYMKNTFYNILDLFSKNFFGLFLSYVILTGSY
jgi:hypothetical protein